MNSPRKRPIRRSINCPLLLAWTRCWANGLVADDFIRNDAHLTSLKWQNYKSSRDHNIIIETNPFVFKICSISDKLRGVFPVNTSTSQSHLNNPHRLIVQIMRDIYPIDHPFGDISGIFCESKDSEYISKASIYIFLWIFDISYVDCISICFDRAITIRMNIYFSRKVPVCWLKNITG